MAGGGLEDGEGGGEVAQGVGLGDANGEACWRGCWHGAGVWGDGIGKDERMKAVPMLRDQVVLREANVCQGIRYHHGQGGSLRVHEHDCGVFEGGSRRRRAF